MMRCSKEAGQCSRCAPKVCPHCHIARCSHHEWQNVTGRWIWNVRELKAGKPGAVSMRGASGRCRDGSRLAVRKRRLLEAAALGALILPGLAMLPDVAWGQVAATLPEVTVVAPRPAPSPPRRQAPARPPGGGFAARCSRAAPVPSALPAYQVIATTPVTGIGFDRNKVPAMAQTVTAEDFSRVYSPNVLDTLQQRIPGVITTDVQGNGFFQDLRYRGFAASPLQGTPQGLAVYMQGVRINEAFGDTVNWDLIPTVAIGRADIWTNNPAFGLNALGGAVSLQMKDGFNYNGFEFDASGGSYGRVGGSMQYGVRSGEWGLYLAAEGFKDDGWRYQSPSRLARFYGDLGWRGTDAEVHFITSIADNYFGVVGPTPLATSQQRLSLDLHLAADHEKSGAAHRDERPLLRERPLDGAEQSLFPQVPAGPRRWQRCRGRALQRPGRQSAVQYAVPGGRRISATAGGELPAPQPEQSAYQLSARTGQHLRHYTLGHGGSHLDQCDHHRRLVAGHQRRQDIRPRQLLHDRWQRRPEQDRFPGQQRARLHLSRFLRWPQRCGAGDGTDRPHRRQYRLCAGQPRPPGIPITASTSTTPSISPIGCR